MSATKTLHFAKHVLIDDILDKDERTVVFVTAADEVTPETEGAGPVVLVVSRSDGDKTITRYDYLSNLGYDIRVEYERQMRKSTIERVKIARVVQMRRVATALRSLDMEASITLGTLANRVADTPRGTTGEPSEDDVEAVVTYLMADEPALAEAIIAAFTAEDTFERAWQVIADVRDASPRAKDDADTGDIVEALRTAGLIRGLA